MVEVGAADSLSRQSRKVVAGAERRNHRSGCDRSLALSAGDEAARRRQLQDGVGRHFEPFPGAARNMDGGQPAGINLDRSNAVDVRRAGSIGWVRHAQRANSGAGWCRIRALPTPSAVRPDRSSPVSSALAPSSSGARGGSERPRGVVKDIGVEPELEGREFVVVRGEDIPGKNCIALIGDDQPCLEDGRVNHPEEPILLLAHADPHLLRKAVDGVSIEYEPLPAVFTIEESERCSEIIWGMDNTLKTFLIAKGDVDRVWAKAYYIVEGEYTTGAQEQLYIENNGEIAAFDLEQGITVWGYFQCPSYVHKALMQLSNLPAEKMPLVHAKSWGYFGGKEHN